MKKLTTAAQLLSSVLMFASCSMQKQLAKQASLDIIASTDFASAHVGISIYDPAANTYVYNYQAEKMFVPASNMKLFTCYEAMKWLGDSLAGLRYDTWRDGVFIEPTGDPTFLLPDFKNQPVYDFLKQQSNIAYIADAFRTQFSPLGRGWAWDDYEADYMAERSELPIYGNCVKFAMKNNVITAMPHFFYNQSFYYFNDVYQKNKWPYYKVTRKPEDNSFHTVFLLNTQPKFSGQTIPFKTLMDESHPTWIKLLEDTLGKNISIAGQADARSHLTGIIRSQPTDSMLKIMMHRSDNFFAEQTLLMISNEKLGIMSDSKIIDTLLKTDFKDLPQKPKWVDGSGLSRYNLISPQDFVWVLTQMKNEFKWERIQTILATGGEGTLGSYYKNYAGKIYAKTGSLSNHLALSGYLITRKGKQLVFSVLVNAEVSPAANIRKGIEKFLTHIIDAY